MSALERGSVSWPAWQLACHVLLGKLLQAQETTQWPGGPPTPSLPARRGPPTHTWGGCWPSTRTSSHLLPPAPRALAVKGRPRQSGLCGVRDLGCPSGLSSPPACPDRSRIPAPLRRRRPMRTCRLARPEARRAAGGRWLAAGGHVREEGAAAGAGVSPTAGGCGGSSSPLEPGPPALLLIYKHTKGRAGVASAAGMGDKKSPTRPKRQPKPSSDEGYWDCSVCTFRNSAEAFKCMMCDVRKGTSTRLNLSSLIFQPLDICLQD
ncbi:YY1-associated factor 2 isoform X3 [Mauremys reevesii]|uniref:YY1-associated factor 2 isoform X3 n=1 Tax=Mauremys reevesii TaxID=260615 RepID=UPI00193FA6A2|nr:YY1-associated factor 2 isoform X3 [Mauremys reevesii]